MSGGLRLAVLGAGNWGKNLLRNFCEILGPEHVVCCDPNEEVRARAQRVHPGIGLLRHADEVWEDDEIEAVVIATPAPSHATLSLRALKSGKHVFVEKPMALRSDEAERLAQEAEEQKRVLMVDHLLLYHPVVEEMLRRIRAGELGELYCVYSRRLNLGVVRSEESVLWSLGAHDIAVMIALMGAPPEKITADGGVFLQHDKQLEDVAFVTMRFPGLKIGHLHVSWLDPNKVRCLTAVGSQKMMVFDDMEPQEKLRIYDKGAYVVAEGGVQIRYGDILIPEIPLVEPLRSACRHFLECIERGETPRSDGRNGVEVVRALEAAERALLRARA